MSDLIKREDAIKAVEECLKLLARPRYTVKTAIEAIPSVDIPQSDDWEKYSDKLWKNAYERGKADGAMIYGNEHNCIMTIFGECSYAETGCGDCAVVEKVRKALSADRPQGEWIPCSERLPTKAGHYLCSFNKPNRIDNIYVDLAYWTGGRWYGYLANEINAWKPLPEPWKGADDETD